MEEYSRPATLDDLKALLHSLHQHHVDYFLIGGMRLPPMDTNGLRRTLTLLFPHRQRRDNGSRMRC